VSASLANERIGAMNDTLIGPDNTEEDEIFAYDMSDEALEAAADTGNENMQSFTHQGCTITPSCPG
jgi:hypothetical protein